MRKRQASAGKFGMRKGQAAVELMVVLAISVTVLIAIYSYSATSMGEMNKQKIVDEAQTSVNSLEQAANDVYKQGVGATKKVFYKVPSGIDQTKSGIESDTFVLNVLSTDVYAKPDVCLQGSLETEQGGHWAWVTAQEECVFVGTQSIAVDKTSSYVTLSQSDSQDDIITVTNNGSETAAMFLAESWAHTDVTFGMSTSEFSLGTGASQPVTLTYTSNASATGNYAGSLGIGASFPSSADQNISLPLNAEVQVAGGGGGSLAVFPSTHVKGMVSNEVDNNSFQACNSGDTILTSISFSDSETIAAWIGAISGIASLAVGECQTVNYTLTVPPGTTPNTYNGTITATNGTYSDTLDITVYVTAAATQAALFSFDWTTSAFDDCGDDDCERIDDFTIQNTSASDPITIDKVTLSWTGDTEGAEFDRIRLDGTEENFSDIASGVEVDIGNVTLSALASSTNNRFDFDDQLIKNECETFSVTFEFSDASTYTTATTGPVYGGAADFTWDWSNPSYGGRGSELRGMAFTNNSATKYLCIERMRVREWSTNDQDGAMLDTIRFRNPNQDHWNGTADDGDWITLDTKKVIDPSESQNSNDNRFEFDDDIDDDGEDFGVDFEFSDSSVYNSSTYDG